MGLHLFNSSSILWGETLDSFFDTVNQHCHLKDAKTNQYLKASWPFAEWFGLTRKDIEGITFHEVVLDKAKLDNQLNTTCIQIAETLDQKVYSEKTRVTNEKMTLSDHLGILRIISTSKIPLLDSQQEVSAIFTYAEDLTHHYNLFFLFKLYQQNYPEQQAIELFFKYLQVDSYFNQTMTSEEVIALLTLYFDSLDEAIALKTPPNIVETDMLNLQSKTTVNSLQDILQTMQDRVKHNLHVL